MGDNILLMGFMGVGKSSLARRLSKKTSLFAIDTDHLIESLEHKNIKEIFEQKGEEYFRQKEQECAYWLENSVKNSIISTGGGFYKVENLKQIGTIIYLRSSFQGIINRLNSFPNAKEKFAKRPLLQDEKKAKKLYKQRVKEYEALADIIIDVEGKERKKIIKKIIKALEKRWSGKLEEMSSV